MGSDWGRDEVEGMEFLRLRVSLSYLKSSWLDLFSRRDSSCAWRDLESVRSLVTGTRKVRSFLKSTALRGRRNSGNFVLGFLVVPENILGSLTTVLH